MSKFPLAIKRSKTFMIQYEEESDYYAAKGGARTALLFAEAINSAVQNILKNPKLGQWYVPPKDYPENLNRKLRVYSLKSISKFPYSIYYIPESKRMILTSIYHHAQHRGAYVISPPYIE